MRLLLVAGAFAIVALGLLASPDAAASHYNGGTVFAERLDDDTVRFDLTTVWSMSQFTQQPVVGELLELKPSTSTYFKFGDGDMLVNDGSSMRLRVTELWPEDDLFVAKIVDLDGSAILHRYEDKNFPVTRIVQLDNYARRGTAHVNNPDSAARAQTLLFDGLEQEDFPAVPRIKHPVLITCAAGIVCTFDLEASIESGEPLKWRLSRDDEANFDSTSFTQPGPPHALYGLDITPDGRVTWDTAGLSALPVKYYSMHATVVGQVTGAAAGIDLLIKLVPPEIVNIAFEDPTPCGEEFKIPFGSDFHMPLKARTDREGHTTYIGAHFLYGGGMILGEPGDVSWGNMSLLDPDVGTYTLIYEASTPGTNKVLPAQASCSVSLEVVGPPEAYYTGKMLQDGGDSAQYQFLDGSVWPEHIDNRTWQWYLGAMPIGDGEMEEQWLKMGRHEICLVIAGTFNGTTYDDRYCREFVVAGTVRDQDADGIADKADNCPGQPNRDQNDRDDNGIGDACDRAPPKPAAPPQPQPPTGLDPDGDGIGEGDNCPAIANPEQQDTDYDGLGDACDLDLDGDGVRQSNADWLDNCPFFANPDQRDENHNDIGDACEPPTFQGSEDLDDSEWFLAEYGPAATTHRSQLPLAFGAIGVMAILLGAGVVWVARTRRS